MKLGDILKLNTTSKVSIKDDEKYLIAGVQNYGKGIVIRKEVLGFELKMKTYQKISSNQLMWCKVDTKNGAFGLTKQQHIGSLASPNMALADINTEKINVEFLEILFRQEVFANYITKLSSGTTNRKYLTPKQLFQTVEIPNLSLSEQTLFVEKIKKIENSKIGDELETQSQLLSQLRQSILQEAIQGKLTENWRAALRQAQGSAAIEPASELLKRILALSLSKGKPRKPLPEITENEIPFELPENWAWCRLGEVGELKRGKSKHRPRNDEKLFENGQYPFIQTGDVSSAKYNNDLITTTNNFYSEFGLQQSEMQPKGTLCITIAANIAECGFLDFDACVPDSIVCFNSLDRSTEKFVYYFIKTAKENLERFAPATAQKNINLGILNALPIPLPPLSEQHVIVEQVEKLLSKCTALQTEIENLNTHSKTLLKALFAETFAKG